MDSQEKAASERMRILDAAISQSSEITVITDLEANIQYVNPAFENSTGYSFDEVKGRNPRILQSGKQDSRFYKELWKTILSGKTWKGRLVNRKKDGSEYIEDASISPIHNLEGEIYGFVALKRDVTEEIKKDEMLRQSQKMEAVGQLAGGIAHDFNNLLTVIKGYSQMIQNDLAADSPFKKSIEEIIKASDLASNLTRQILLYSRKQDIDVKVFEINSLIFEMKKMLSRLIGENIKIAFETEQEIWPIRADMSNIEQIVINLVLNSKDAMPEGGKITIRTGKIIPEEEDTTTTPALQKGKRYVMLTVSDTGTGMTEDVKKRIFEPFFTTKSIGQGSGLGLAVVYGIVQRHSGCLKVDSEPGKGTVFKIFFPALDPAAKNKAVSSSSTNIIKLNVNILIVEDEESVMNLIRAICEKEGWEVVCAKSVEEARTLFASHYDSFDMIISDILLPDGNGISLAEEFRKKSPEIKILLASAYSEEKAKFQILKRKGIPFIQKPFDINEFRKTVKKIIRGQ